MREKLGRRVTRLLSASMHSLVASFESRAPESLMEEAIREMDGVIEEARSELGRQLAQKHLAETRLGEETKRHEALGGQIEVAVAQNRDDLAEIGIAEQMDVEAIIPVLSASIKDCMEQEKELEGFIQALQSKKREMRAEMAVFRKNQTKERLPEAKDRASLDTKAEKAGSLFDRILENASGLPARGLNTGSAAKLAELEELSRRNAITERLKALKTGKE
ncbi:PspA/IM30 family protein [Desulfobotulus sp. H1]|uniref:PspA/IM30 family protein n=1 Tax=Desulfobotulus pelophilus TaxID=2823377 RepID=A0ABT3NAB9_9BACT|nr:PspA/IM30 family protein [Desulfobotulus pelophilus]MCW7754399.1 PspA/IM30 family protein [Desulfobotulus pelophilus]